MGTQTAAPVTHVAIDCPACGSLMRAREGGTLYRCEKCAHAPEICLAAPLTPGDVEGRSRQLGIYTVTVNQGAA